MPKSKSDFKELTDKRKQEIIECGLFFFVSKGYSGTSIDNITKKLNISHGLFYHYFSNKEELLLAVRSSVRAFLIPKLNFKEEDPVKYFIKMNSIILSLIKNIHDCTYLLFFLIVCFDKQALEIYKKRITKRDSEKPFYYLFLNFNKLEQQGRLHTNSKDSFFSYLALITGLSTSRFRNKEVRVHLISPNSIISLFIKENIYV